MKWLFNSNENWEQVKNAKKQIFWERFGESMNVINATKREYSMMNFQLILRRGRAT